MSMRWTTGEHHKLAGLDFLLLFRPVLIFGALIVESWLTLGLALAASYLITVNCEFWRADVLDEADRRRRAEARRGGPGSPDDTAVGV